jgi:hydroxymethylbilane synthase
VAVECRRDDAATREVLSHVDDAATRHAVEVERAFLGELGSGCSLPVGGHAGDGQLTVFLADGDRSTITSVELGGDAGDLEIARRAAHGAQAALR